MKQLSSTCGSQAEQIFRLSTRTWHCSVIHGTQQEINTRYTTT